MGWPAGYARSAAEEEPLQFSARPPMTWYQHEIKLPSFPRGPHPITHLVLDAVPEVAQLRVGLLHVFLRHTSASLSINENADPDVLEDLDRVLDVRRRRISGTNTRWKGQMTCRGMSNRHCWVAGCDPYSRRPPLSRHLAGHLSLRASPERRPSAPRADRAGRGGGVRAGIPASGKLSFPFAPDRFGTSCAP